MGTLEGEWGLSGVPGTVQKGVGWHLQNRLLSGTKPLFFFFGGLHSKKGLGPWGVCGRVVFSSSNHRQRNDKECHQPHMHAKMMCITHRTMRTFPSLVPRPCPE